MAIIYHITTRQEWAAAQAAGHYESVSLPEEGYIHCSEERQIPGVLERYYRDKSDLLRLTIETGRLTSPLFYDWSPSIEDTFPHIYGRLNLDAVVETEEIESR
jgi:uncharacterized protein (DUF952 family)